jgi:TRAP-type uncharacterized transport system substrate-binding protein
LIIAAVLALRFVFPAPPDHLKIAASTPGSYFSDTAEIYRAELAKNGVELEIIHTRGAAENLAFLNAGKVDIALTHRGLTVPNESPNLASLGSISYEPLWVFQRSGVKKIHDLTELKGLRVATGKPGSKVAVISKKLLNASGVDEANTTFFYEDMEVAEKQLLSGRIDAAIFMDPPENPKIHHFFVNKIINEVSLRDAEALKRHFRYLHVIHIPPSGIDLTLEQPSAELLTISTTAILAIRKNCILPYST